MAQDRRRYCTESDDAGQSLQADACVLAERKSNNTTKDQIASKTELLGRSRSVLIRHQECNSSARVLSTSKHTQGEFLGKDQ
jgi:hypothetical protein